jgi:hypothetical protein
MIAGNAQWPDEGTSAGAGVGGRVTKALGMAGTRAFLLLLPLLRLRLRRRNDLTLNGAAGAPLAVVSVSEAVYKSEKGNSDETSADAASAAKAVAGDARAEGAGEG